MLEELLNSIFPEQCINCGKAGSSLCAICERTIITRPIAITKSTATLFDYHNPIIKKGIWALKYKGKKSIGAYFGTALYREFFKHLAYGKREESEIILIPVPANTKTLSWRGYNHATVIAKTIVASAKKDGLELILRADILFKKREVFQQAKTESRERRIANISEAFGIHNGEYLTGKTVILIDDVITTGATIKEARRVVKLYKPKRVLAIAVAH